MDYSDGENVGQVSKFYEDFINKGVKFDWFTQQDVINIER